LLILFVAQRKDDGFAMPAVAQQVLACRRLLARQLDGRPRGPSHSPCAPAIRCKVAGVICRWTDWGSRSAALHTAMFATIERFTYLEEIIMSHGSSWVRSLRRACLVALVGALAQVPCWAQTTAASPAAADMLAQAFVTIDGQSQSRALAEVLLREWTARGNPVTSQTLSEIRDALIDQALMVREATRAGLDGNPLLQAQIEILRQRSLVNAWQQMVLQSVQSSEEDLKGEYDRQVAVLGVRELRLRQLLVREEPTARLLHDRIRAGDKVAALASEYSVDADTRAEGGLGGWVAEGGLAVPLRQAVKSLGPGQLVPAPVRTTSGWHVVQIEEVRPFVPPAFSQVLPQLRQAIAQRALQQRLESLRREAKVN